MNLIRSCTFSNNTSYEKMPVSFAYADFYMIHSIFTDNYSTKETAGLFVSFANSNIINCTFDNARFSADTLQLVVESSTSELTGGFIYVSVGVTMTIDYCTFSYGYGFSGGSIYLSGSSSLNLYNSNFFSNVVGSQGGVLYLANYNQIVIYNCGFYSSWASRNGAVIYSSSGELSLYQNIIEFSTTSFGGYYMAVIYLSSTTLVVDDLTIEDTSPLLTIKKSGNGGAIYSEDSTSLIITNSRFSNLIYSELGGAIYLTQLESTKTFPKDPSHSIINVTFSNNKAYKGGAVYVDNVENTYLENWVFTNNSAIQDDKEAFSGYGGAIFYHSTENSEVNLNSSNSFSDNTAEISGGAIYWDYYEPYNVEAVSYSNNWADEYGNNFASFAQNMLMISSRRNLNSITSQQSGGALPTIVVYLKDKFNQTVGSDSSSSCTLTVSSSTSGATYTPVLSGTTTVIANAGVWTFSGITFTAEPGQNYSLSFSTDGIDTSLPSNQEYLATTGSTTSNLAFEVALRECIAGESFSATGACIACEADTEYSLESPTSPGSCKDCQTTKMFCNGGSDIGPKPGYWRSSNTTDNFIAWLYAGACLGYEDTYNNNLGEWFTGYQGILCADWEVGYSRTGTYEWGKCPNPILNAIQIVLILIAVVIGLVIMIRSTLNGALQRKNIQSVYIKILMNHLQLIILTASFDFEWPSNVERFFETTEPVAQVSSQILSFDCFLDQRSDSDDSQTVRLFYQKMVMYSLLPLICAGGSIAFWYVYYCRKSKLLKEKRIGRIMSTLIILLFLIHPTIVQYMFSNFNWYKIDDEYRIMDDLEVTCWDSTHIRYSVMIAVPSLIIWGLGIPWLAALVLTRNKNDLEMIETREKFGFLYNGYKSKFYYWESVNMYRKIIIILISVFLKIAGVITQALVIFLVLIVFLILNVKLLPFAFKSLNDMEILSIMTSMLTIYWGLFYISHNPEVYNSSDDSVQEADNGLRLNENAKLFFFFVIIGSNFAFFVYWGYKMFDEARNTIRNKFAFLYLYCCLWGNKVKLEREKLQREIDDENDVLKENFEKTLDEIRLLQENGELVLNEITLSKIQAYLQKDKFLEAVVGIKKITQEEKKEMKRNRRKIYAANMLQNIDSERTDREESKVFDSEQNGFEKLPPIGRNFTNEKFEKDIDEFLTLNKSEMKNTNPDIGDTYDCLSGNKHQTVQNMLSEEGESKEGTNFEIDQVYQKSHRKGSSSKTKDVYKSPQKNSIERFKEMNEELKKLQEGKHQENKSKEPDELRMDTKNLTPLTMSALFHSEMERYRSSPVPNMKSNSDQNEYQDEISSLKKSKKKQKKKQLKSKNIRSQVSSVRLKVQDKTKEGPKISDRSRIRQRNASKKHEYNDLKVSLEDYIEKNGKENANDEEQLENAMNFSFTLSS